MNGNEEENVKGLSECRITAERHANYVKHIIYVFCEK